jgi:hypothetical protein
MCMEEAMNLSQDRLLLELDSPCAEIRCQETTSKNEDS